MHTETLQEINARFVAALTDPVAIARRAQWAAERAARQAAEDERFLDGLITAMAVVGGAR